MAPPKVFANGRSILHAGDGLTHVAAAPDVCKTPSPAGPVPVPYVNAASDADLARGTKSVRIGGSSVAHEGAHLRTSTGDEPGAAGGGVISAKTKGKLTWGTASADVRVEGKGVVRFMDITHHNGNSFNTAFTAMGGTGLAYADDFDGKCPICAKGPRQHRVLETPNSAALCAEIIERLTDRFRTAGADASLYARPKGKRNWSGYMVGVMVCKCARPRTFAAMSGETLDGFVTVARGVVDHVIDGGAVGFVEFLAANASSAATRIHKKRQMGAAWNAAREKALRKERGYNPPGNCAGAKLMARAGHAPLEMTERFFMPPGQGRSWAQEYRLLTTEHSPARLASMRPRSVEGVLQNDAAKRELRSFRENDDSVASCHTCQELLFMTNCPVRSC
jgi:hypothetical protein